MAEGRPVPALYGSEDIRPLNMEDFKYAHDQVNFFQFPTSTDGLFRFPTFSMIVLAHYFASEVLQLHAWVHIINEH